MNNDDRAKTVEPFATIPGESENRDPDNADETLPSSPAPSDEPEADEFQRKVDEIERKVADGN
ncbi:MULTISPECIES: hypothetical protein [Pseudomonas]|uniref:Uncharacterized protein n=1 Tax=Pseudomonas izuensis TaxID=2684212 RepID=A0ABM7RX18_9PSED|nr:MULTISPECIES: hypothetical protein [Pseudomonas]RKS24863.1 hypothetical protein BJ917_2345 [Pseudomonas sp. WPR_5_2]BCX69057.1 hypothetical protein LAB08_R36990 [Pseudomonas izuensis]